MLWCVLNVNFMRPLCVGLNILIWREPIKICVNYCWHSGEKILLCVVFILFSSQYGHSHLFLLKLFEISLIFTSVSVTAKITRLSEIKSNNNYKPSQNKQANNTAMCHEGESYYTIHFIQVSLQSHSSATTLTHF